ncbi:SH3-like domain-containing protein [Jannaschia marina]|uniref:SH3-like domain-containing protein n=1 Tax=Jannaschia marina TaxID=2741674 RepID=UPI0022A7827A|nr:SH3-like domain-containing protein [Jannaschia marina]
MIPDPTGKRWHDMGGDLAGPVPGDDHDFALWEKRVDALVILSGLKGVFTVDGLRRVLEDMGEDAFETMTYYERWVASLNQNMLEQGVYTVAELGARIEAVQARGTTYGEATDAGA